MRYCVVDLECTCWEYNDPEKQSHETIEIGAVLLDGDLNILKSISIYARPVEYPQLTSYCTQLTGISQEDVDTAPTFDNAMREFSSWVGDCKDVVLCSWGEFDKKQLMEECVKHACAYPFDQCHINIKQEYLRKLNRTKGGLQKACRVCGISFEGTPHNGKDDAIMAAKVLKSLSIIKE